MKLLFDYKSSFSWALSGITFVVGLAVMNLSITDGWVFTGMAMVYVVVVTVLVINLMQGRHQPYKYQTVEELSTVAAVLSLGILMFVGAQRY